MSTGRFAATSPTSLLIGALLCRVALVSTNVEEDYYPTDFMRNELEPVFHDSEYALNLLISYYNFWYRVWNLFGVSDVCKLEKRDRVRICADVIHACHPELKDVDVETIRDEMEEVGVCYRQKFQTRLREGGFWETTKRMYRCEAFTAAGVKVNRFYVSAAGKAGAAIVFDRGVGNSADKYPRVAGLVRGLVLDRALRSASADKKDDPNPTIRG